MLALQISKPLDGVIVADDMAFDTGHVGSLRVVALTLLTARRALLAAPCTYKLIKTLLRRILGKVPDLRRHIPEGDRRCGALAKGPALANRRGGHEDRRLHRQV